MVYFQITTSIMGGDINSVPHARSNDGGFILGQLLEYNSHRVI